MAAKRRPGPDVLLQIVGTHGQRSLQEPLAAPKVQAEIYLAMDSYVNPKISVTEALLPRTWTDANSFVWADAVLALVLVALATLSYVMLAHLLRRRKGGENGADDADGATSAADGGDEVGTTARPRTAGSCLERGKPVDEEIDGMTALMRASSQGDEVGRRPAAARASASPARGAMPTRHHNTPPRNSSAARRAPPAAATLTLHASLPRSCAPTSSSAPAPKSTRRTPRRASPRC